MKISGKKVKWETIALAAIAGVMASSFVAMMYVVLSGSPAGTSSDDAAVPAAGRPVGRSTEPANSKPLVMHDLGDRNVSWDAMREENSHQGLIPDIPETRQKNANDDLGSLMDLRPPVSLRGKKKADEEEEEDFLSEKKEKVSTGWGWLADDIMEKRMAREESAAEEELENEDPLTGEDKDELAARRDEKRNDDKKKDGNMYFMDRSFQADESRFSMKRYDSTDRYVKNDEDRETEREEAAAAEGTDDETSDPSQRASWLDANGREEGFVARDPFAARGEESRQNARAGEPFGGREQDGSSRSWDAETRFRSVSYAEDQSARIVGDAASDSRRLSEGWTGYASDAMFNSGGGYTPRGVNISGGDSMFSDAGVFESSLFSFSAPAASSIDGIATPGSSFDTPSSASLIATPESSSELSTPRALPW